MDYTIRYTDHRHDDQEVKCSAFEDAERIAQFLADMYGGASLFDGMYTREYIQNDTVAPAFIPSFTKRP